MKSTIEFRRHPIAACAAAFAALLAAGCGNDEGAMSMQSPGMSPSHALASYPLPDPGFVRGSSPGQNPGFGRYPGAVQEDAFAPERRGTGSQAAPGRMVDDRAGGTLDALMAWERQDMGVRPTRELHGGDMHGPTPNQIPGGQVITTKGLLPLLQQGIPVHVFDVLGMGQTLPNAIPAVRASEPGSFDDQTQQEFAQMLQQVTRGNANAPLVFYCQGPQCWMSYNAALRAIALGYRNVLWYRGGMEAWNRAGQPFAPEQRQG